MVSVEIAPESLKRLEALRRAAANANRQMAFGGDTAITRMVAFVTTGLGKAWEKEAPRLTGTLAAATREQIFAEQGLVDIDPTITNPVFGGNPADYGPAVHSRNMWVDRVMTNDAPGILNEAGERFFGEIAEIFNQ